MSVSIKDIAQAAGVSHSTVSRALADSPLISEAARQRIQALAEQMGYVPNAQARGLVLGRTMTIGVVVTTIADPFVAEVVQGIESTAHANGYSVILTSSDNDPEREVQSVEMLRARRADAVIVASSRIGDLYQDDLEETGVPVVLINSHNDQGRARVVSISVDNRHGGYLATQHLLGLGHRRIAYISGLPGHSDDSERRAGYAQALHDAGLPIDDTVVLSGDGRASGGEQALDALLALRPRPTAAFCYNDMTAIGLVSAAQRARLAVPRRLAVVGFDDIPFAALMHPSLSTIAQPKHEMGRRAVERALALLSSDAEQPDHLSLQGQLIVRESSGGHASGVR
ncbi:MAG: LacI family DNA-binding transcriptional regulator [Anaerolineales bacterium]